MRNTLRKIKNKIKYIFSSSNSDPELVEILNALCKLSARVKWESTIDGANCLIVHFDDITEDLGLQLTVRDYQDQVKIRITQINPIRTTNSFFPKTIGNMEYIRGIYHIFKPKPIIPLEGVNQVVFNGKEYAKIHIDKILTHTL